ncbi:MAG: copper resistance protein CopC [Nitrosotalea sp.]
MIERKRGTKSTIKIILLVFVAVSVLVVVPNIPKSYAHAFVIDSNPAPATSLNTPPSQVEVDFVDPIDMKYSQIKVLDSNGKAVNNNDWHFITDDHEKTVVTLPTIPNGIYTVYTKVLDATDGHTTTNAFVFAVGEPVPQNLLNAKTNVSFSDIVSVPDAIARYPSLVGQIIVVGAAFSSFWLWSPISRISALKDAFESTRVKIDKSMTKIVLIGSIIILGGDFAMISSEAYSINSGLIDAINTTFGNLWLVRMVLSLALFGVALVVYLKQKQSNTVLPKSQVAALFGIGIAVLATTTLISHGAASGKMLPPILDFAHNVVASLWIGSVIYIAFVVMPRLKQIQDYRAGVSVLSLAIPRFSTIVVALLGIVVMTGPTLLYVLENNLSLTLASIYGEILIVKLSLAGAMIGFGAFNQSIIYRKALNEISISLPDACNTPTSISQNGSSNNNKKSILVQFDKSIKIEAIIGFVLIASIAVLVDSGLPGIQFQDELVQQQQQIPHVFAFATPLESSSQFTETGFTDTGDKIVLSVDPFYSGKNNVTLSFFDSNNNPIDTINSTKITLNQVDKVIGPIEVDSAQKISPGVFSVNTAAFAISGHWQAQVEGVTTALGALDAVTSFDDIYVKPNLNQLQANITEFKMPDNRSLPVYPVYDNIRNVVWVGDNAINSGRIWEFDLGSKHYTEHKMNGTNIVTFATLDFNNNIWYIDPITKILGYYEPDTGKEQKYRLPNNVTASGLAIDNTGNLLMTSASTNQLLEFDTSAKTFHSINLPANSQPLGISIDQSTNQIWIAESNSSKIANVDPSQNYKITEYGPTNGTLSTPTAILFDSVTGKVFVSEHDGKAVSAFDPLTKTFQKYNTDQNGLPFGMTFDANHDLWLAQHTLDKIAVIDPRTGQTNEFSIPTSSSFTQWVAADSQGDIILAEERAGALGILTTSLKPGFVENTAPTNIILGVPLGFSYSDVIGPAIAGGLISVAFFYSKSVIDIRNSARQIKKNFSQ